MGTVAEVNARGGGAWAFSKKLVHAVVIDRDEVSDVGAVRLRRARSARHRSGGRRGGRVQDLVEVRCQDREVGQIHPAVVAEVAVREGLASLVKVDGQRGE